MCHQQCNKMLFALFITFLLTGKEKSTKSNVREKDFSSAGYFCGVKLKWKKAYQLLKRF